MAPASLRIKIAIEISHGTGHARSNRGRRFVARLYLLRDRDQRSSILHVLLLLDRHRRRDAARHGLHPRHFHPVHAAVAARKRSLSRLAACGELPHRGLAYCVFSAYCSYYMVHEYVPLGTERMEHVEPSRSHHGRRHDAADLRSTRASAMCRFSSSPSSSILYAVYGYCRAGHFLSCRTDPGRA